MNPRLGFLLMFEGDLRKVNAAIKNVSSFSSVSGILKNGDNDVTSLYIATTPRSVGNVLVADSIGDWSGIGSVIIPAGSYRYFITGIYGGKKRSWYWDILVLPKDLSQLNYRDIPLEDYNPLLEEITITEGDYFAKQIVIPGLTFESAAGVLKMFSDDVTGTYCTSSPSFGEDTLTTHSIGGSGTLPAGEYGYFITGQYNNQEGISTWFLKIKVLPKQGVING